MIVGIPNVGKSTLLNRLVGKNKVMAADKPGVTRGQQWVTIAKGLWQGADFASLSDGFRGIPHGDGRGAVAEADAQP